jgi:hypothetical protein
MNIDVNERLAKNTFALRKISEQLAICRNSWPRWTDAERVTALQATEHSIGLVRSETQYLLRYFGESDPRVLAYNEVDLLVVRQVLELKKQQK